MSVAAQLAQGSEFYISGSSGTPEVLTAIAVGYPTILTITGHAGLANGDSITLAGFTGVDAATLNAKVAVVKNYATGITNDTIAIDINTLGKTITIDAGNSTATPTAWIEILELTALKPTSASAPDIDVTDLKSTAKEFRTGLRDNGSLSSDYFVLESDAGQAAVEASFADSTAVPYKLVTPAGVTRTFTASCKKFGALPELSVDGVQKGTMEWKISGEVVRS
jgi:hypothetical protein